MSRVLVIGLDAFTPDFVSQWLPELPNIRRVMENGIYGSLESIVQPITPVAWTSMMSGLDPSHFGFTDFTYRVEHSYTDFRLVHSRIIDVPMLYTLLPEAGQRAIMIGVPITYPPVTIPNGICVSCFMAPSVEKRITTPSYLQEQILAQTSSPYVLDVTVPEKHVTEQDRDKLLHQIHEMDRQRFDTASYLMDTQPWDLLFMVALGTDRVGHYFMRYLDPLHGRYENHPRYRDAIKEHYQYCDHRIGALIEQAGSDTVVLLVSDHGMQRLDGKVNLNDWLVANDYLTLSTPAENPVRLAKAEVDWSRTRAWSHGYAGQIYLNVCGRESEGCVDPSEVDDLLNELDRKLGQLTTSNGVPLHVRTIRRQAIYDGIYIERCPDLFVQIENLRYLTSDLVGHGKLVTPITELGIDDGSHSSSGFLALSGPAIPASGRFEALTILDVAPTLLTLLDIPVPNALPGHPIHLTDNVYSQEDEEKLTNRLRALYLE